MRTMDVDPRDWSAYLDAFTRRHAHAPVTVEIHDPQQGQAREVLEGPLLGVEVEHDAEGHDSIFLALGEQHAPHWSRVVAHPCLVSIFQDLDGADRAISLESADGGYTYLSV